MYMYACTRDNWSSQPKYYILIINILQAVHEISYQFRLMVLSAWSEALNLPLPWVVLCPYVHGTLCVHACTCMYMLAIACVCIHGAQ